MGVARVARAPVRRQVLGEFHTHGVQKEDERGRRGEGVDEGGEEDVGGRGLGGRGGEAEGGACGRDEDLRAGLGA